MSDAKVFSHKNPGSMINSIERQLKPAKKHHVLIQNFMRHWQLYLIMLLPIVYIVVFHYIPMYGVQLAFRRFNPMLGITGSPWAGFQFFDQFFRSPSSREVIWNTLEISTYSIIAGFPIPIILAIAINEVRNSFFKKTVQMVTYAPFFISTVVVVGMLLQLLASRTGLIGRVIAMIVGQEVHLMNDPALFQDIFVWSGIWQGAGIGAVIYLAALAGVNPELQEAAVIDGASKIQRIWNVDIQCIRPTIIMLLILSIAGIMNVGFERVFLMQNPLNLSESEVISTFVYKVGLVSANFSFATAVGLFNSIINCILLVTVNFISKRAGEASLW